MHAGRISNRLLARIARLALFFAEAVAADASKFNVLFIVADDYRPELATHGSPAKTQNLDRLAKQPLSSRSSSQS